MIGYLEGTLQRKAPEAIIINCGGVGYQVHVSFQTFCELPEVGQPVALEIYHHVKEDRSDLFGFLNLREKTLFEQLIGVSGIGPKTGLAMLSPQPAVELEAAIEGENVDFITRIPGIGKKTAQRVVLELKGKLKLDAEDAAATGAAGTVHAMRMDAVGALVNLGYKAQQVEKVLDAVLKEHEPADFEELLKHAFERLSGV